MNRDHSFTAVFLCIATVASNPGAAQDGKAQTGAPQNKEPVVFTTPQDRQNMLDQLGIAKLRPGRNSNPNSPNPANYDQAKANPYPKLPEVLETKDRRKVTTPEQWWKERRPEIVEMLEREVYGRIPENVPKVKWEVRETREIAAGGKPATQRHIVGIVDNSDCPGIRVNISMSLTLPKQADGPVPVLMSFGWTPFEPSPFSLRGRDGGPAPASKEDILIKGGWGCATLNPTTVQDDAGGWQPRRFGPGADPNAKPTGAGLTRGIIGLTNHGQPRKPDVWGALRAWAWGASRGLDYLETVPEVDAKRVGIAGVSRYGKAALVAMAFDQRFAMGLIASSGRGGTALYRRDFGESLENLATTGGYHWMAGNYLKYSAEESSSGRKTAGDLPVDSHMTLALCAPRLTFISHGIPERGDAHWLDHQGSFMAAIAAQPVFRLLGARDLSRSDDYMRENMPAVNEALLDGALAWRQHDGGHTDGPNVEHFIRWAKAQWGKDKKEDVSARPAPDRRSLKEAVGDRFKIGVGVSDRVLQQPEDAALIRRHFQILTELLTQLKQKGAPVDAYGMQGHFELGEDSIPQIRETFDELRKLGIKVVVSELDIDVVTRSRWWADNGKHRDELAKYDPYKYGLPEAIQQKQIEQYVELFKLFAEYSDLIVRVSFWNLHDGQSWLNYFPWNRVNHPLLFDRNRRPKPAFDAVYAALRAPRSVHAPIERRDPNSRVAHQQLIVKTKQGKIDVYFEGDSITRRWGATDYPKLLAHWEKHFHGWNAANYGWGGDTTHNILWRLQNGELDGVSPKIIVLQAGTNNLPWSGPADDAAVDDVVGGIKAIIATFQKDIPHAVVVLTALFPRPQNQTLAPTIERINDQLKTLADGKKIRFLNINDRLTDDKGDLLPGVSRDGLHLEEKGYDVWATALKPIFAELLGPPAEMDQAPPPTGDPSAAQRSAPSARP